MMSDELKSSLSKVNGRINEFGIIFRKNIFQDIEGVVYKAFYVYVDDGKI